jgi:hypothetical protein
LGIELPLSTWVQSLICPDRVAGRAGSTCTYVLIVIISDVDYISALFFSSDENAAQIVSLYL